MAGDRARPTAAGTTDVARYKQIIQEELQREFPGPDSPLEILHICVSHSPEGSEDDYGAAEDDGVADELDDDLSDQDASEDLDDIHRRIQGAFVRVEARRSEWHTDPPEE